MELGEEVRSGGGVSQRHCSTISMINIQFTKSAAITEKRVGISESNAPVLGVQYCSLLSAMTCSQAYGSSQLLQGVSLVHVLVKTLHGASTGS